MAAEPWWRRLFRAIGIGSNVQFVWTYLGGSTLVGFVVALATRAATDIPAWGFIGLGIGAFMLTFGLLGHYVSMKWPPVPARLAPDGPAPKLTDRRAHLAALLTDALKEGHRISREDGDGAQEWQQRVDSLVERALGPIELARLHTERTYPSTIGIVYDRRLSELLSRIEVVEVQQSFDDHERWEAKEHSEPVPAPSVRQPLIKGDPDLEAFVTSWVLPAFGGTTNILVEATRAYERQDPPLRDVALAFKMVWERGDEMIRRVQRDEHEDPMRLLDTTLHYYGEMRKWALKAIVDYQVAVSRPLYRHFRERDSDLERELRQFSAKPGRLDLRGGMAFAFEVTVTDALPPIGTDPDAET